MKFCPRGYICFTHTNLIGSLIIILLVLYIINKESYNKLYTKLTAKAEEDKSHKSESLNSINLLDDTVLVDTDKMKMENPLSPPLMRNYHTEAHSLRRIPRQDLPVNKGLPINIETRGSGGDYQQIGTLSKETISDENSQPGNNTESNILPLYGRPTYKGSQQWNYYTATDKLNQIKIPLNVSGTDCTDDRGCKEIYAGDSITIPEYNGSFKANIYKFDKPRYIPYIV